jgi:hypothetical protein
MLLHFLSISSELFKKYNVKIHLKIVGLYLLFVFAGNVSLVEYLLHQIINKLYKTFRKLYLKPLTVFITET